MNLPTPLGTLVQCPSERRCSYSQQADSPVCSLLLSSFKLAWVGGFVIQAVMHFGFFALFPLGFGQLTSLSIMP